MSYFRWSWLLLIVLLFSSGFSIINNLAGATQAQQPSTVRLPIGQNTFKIEISETGLYELTYPELQAAGMEVNKVNPTTFEMMVAGQPVAYEWIGDNDSSFEPDEKLRFFGEAYAGSRHDQQYVTNNVYWLWFKGSAQQISQTANETGHSQATYWNSTERFKEDRFFDFTDTNQNAGWAFVESDSWFWQVLLPSTVTPVTVTLPHPIDVGVDASYTIETFSDTRLVGSIHQVSVDLNNASAQIFGGTSAIEAMIHSGTSPASNLNEGLNTFHLRPVSGVKMFLNEINITYTRHFRADGDQLLFNYAETGGVEFVVDNLSVSDSETLIVWDVSNPTEPVAIPIDTGDLGTGVGNTVRFGRTLDGDSTFLVSTLANVQTPIISKYTPIELNPTDGAEWIAVTHSELRPQIDRLATYRAQANRIETHVVDIEDIINQYGFGYPVPDAIHSYMQAGYQTWSTKPKYLLLAGDATINPRQRTCVDPTGKACLFPWNTSDLDYVPTYLVHQDPFVGLIPSDHPFSLLEGDDLIPEIAVGRITVGNRDFNNTFNSTSALDDQAKNIVDKIIRYEAALENEEPWTSRFAFLADDADAGGAFCYDNENAASRIPDEFLKTFFCLDDYIADNPTGAQNRINAEFTNEINNNSAAIVNYRGHGSVVNWGGGLLTRDDRVNMFNNGKPFVIISADCLDNYFAFNNLMSLSEAFMRAPNAGSVAHWGSTGLGFSWEHTILHNAFYDGLYEEFLPTIGDAIVHAKTVYEPSPGSRSELYAFTLQGDPAMNMPYVKHEVFIPIVIKPQIDIPSPFPRVSED